MGAVDSLAAPVERTYRPAHDWYKANPKSKPAEFLPRDRAGRAEWSIAEARAAYSPTRTLRKVSDTRRLRGTVRPSCVSLLRPGMACRHW